jgi:flagellar biosynthesis protein FlhG
MTANVGVQLARAGRRVLLVDLDLGLANLNVILRLNPQHTVEDFLSGERALKECVVRGPGGVDVLPAGSGTLDMGRPDSARRRQYLDGLRELAKDYELVIGDSAAGIGPDVVAFSSSADLVVVVTTPEPAALTDAFGLVKALDSHATETGAELPTPELLLNRVSGSDEAETIAAKLRAVCERFLARAPRLAGWVPLSREVQAASSAEQPFAISSPNSLAAKGLSRLADRIARLVPASGARESA